MPIAIPAAIIAGKLIGGFLQNKGKAKQAKEQRRADIAGLNLKQTMGEDKRLGRLNLAQSILGNLKPGAAYGGRVNFNTAIDPAVLAELQKRRSYDFSKVVADQNVGGGTGLIGSLFSDAANAVGSAYGTGAIGGGAGGGLVNSLYGAAGAPPSPYGYG